MNEMDVGSDEDEPLEPLVDFPTKVSASAPDPVPKSILKALQRIKFSPQTGPIYSSFSLPGSDFSGEAYNRSLLTLDDFVSISRSEINRYWHATRTRMHLQLAREELLRMILGGPMSFYHKHGAGVKPELSSYLSDVWSAWVKDLIESWLRVGFAASYYVPDTRIGYRPAILDLSMHECRISSGRLLGERQYAYRALGTLKSLGSNVSYTDPTGAGPWLGNIITFEEPGHGPTNDGHIRSRIYLCLEEEARVLKAEARYEAALARSIMPTVYTTEAVPAIDEGLADIESSVIESKEQKAAQQAVLREIAASNRTVERTLEHTPSGTLMSTDLSTRIVQTVQKLAAVAAVAQPRVDIPRGRQVAFGPIGALPPHPEEARQMWFHYCARIIGIPVSVLSAGGSVGAETGGGGSSRERHKVDADAHLVKLHELNLKQQTATVVKAMWQVMYGVERVIDEQKKSSKPLEQEEANAIMTVEVKMANMPTLSIMDEYWTKGLITTEGMNRYMASTYGIDPDSLQREPVPPITLAEAKIARESARLDSERAIKLAEVTAELKPTPATKSSSSSTKKKKPKAKHPMRSKSDEVQEGHKSKHTGKKKTTD